MNKNKKNLPVLSLFLLVALSCNVVTSGIQQTTATPLPPTQTASPVPPTETIPPVVIPASETPPPSATLELAPICQDTMITSTPFQCHAPIAEQTSTYCQEKKPYNIILINPDASYEMTGRDVKCFENGVKDDGRKIVVCTGKMASSFSMTVCDPTCVVATAQADSTNCPPDYKYNNLLGCCTLNYQSAQTNCTTLNLETIRCVINCSAYIRKAACNQHTDACYWNSLERLCLPR